MTSSSDDLRTTLEAGRQAVAIGLRRLADRVEALPVNDAADALAWVEDAVTYLQREIARVLARP